MLLPMNLFQCFQITWQHFYRRLIGYSKVVIRRSTDCIKCICIASERPIFGAQANAVAVHSIDLTTFFFDKHNFVTVWITCKHGRRTIFQNHSITSVFINPISQFYQASYRLRFFFRQHTKIGRIQMTTIFSISFQKWHTVCRFQIISDTLCV